MRACYRLILMAFLGFESPRGACFNYHFLGSNFRLSVALQLASDEWVNPAEDSVLAENAL